MPPKPAAVRRAVVVVKPTATEKPSTAKQNAGATLAKLAELEKVEEERVRNQTEQKILGSDLDWQLYMHPKDPRDLDDCARVDAINRSMFEYNNSVAGRINDLLVKLGRNKVNSDPPPKYLAMARERIEEMMFEENFRMIQAIKYLADRDLFPKRDYVITDAPETADAIAETAEIKRLIDTAGSAYIDISPAVGATHKSNCTCENRWDGVGEHCVGESVRLRWRRLKHHHFLRPQVCPEKW